MLIKSEVESMFEPALRSLGPWSVFGPTSFTGYIQRHGMQPAGTTQSIISVDSMQRLAPELRNAETMVLRLGRAKDGPGTQFALVRAPGHLSDFFLHDDAIFTGSATVFLPDTSVRSLFVYYVLPNRTETSLVNLAMASGLLGSALDLDMPHPLTAPATGTGTYTFRFRPHDQVDRVLEHHAGQVEIDAAFVGRRLGRDYLVLVESKASNDSTLAKHKLVYPLLALAPHVPSGMGVIPVYVRMHATKDAIHYHIVECDCPDPRTGILSLDALQPKQDRYLVLPLPRLT